MSDLATVSARVGTPTADGSATPVGASSYIGDDTCDTTRITDLQGGVRHEVGLSEPADPGRGRR